MPLLDPLSYGTTLNGYLVGLARMTGR